MNDDKGRLVPAAGVDRHPPCADPEPVLREIDALRDHLERRRASARPLRASLVGAYREAIQRCYERLDREQDVHEASSLDPLSRRRVGS